MQYHDDAQHIHSVLSPEDTASLLRAISSEEKRVKKIKLSDRHVWLKRQGTEKLIWWRHLQSAFSKLLPYSFMRPGKVLNAEGMNEREVVINAKFKNHGFNVPEIIYRTPTSIVLEDVGPTISDRLWQMRETDKSGRELLLIQSVDALGALHAARLCHGRPHVRDFYLKDGEVGFLDFEECPEEVMPLEVAQARDLWLLFLPISTLSNEPQKTFQIALDQWRLRAPNAAQVELRQMIAVLSRFLPFVRLIGRVRMGSDLRRFILATEFLKTALETDAAPDGAGKAGKDDRT